MKAKMRPCLGWAIVNRRTGRVYAGGTDPRRLWRADTHHEYMQRVLLTPVKGGKRGKK
jgi:hypothetical protein